MYRLHTLLGLNTCQMLPCVWSHFLAHRWKMMQRLRPIVVGSFFLLYFHCIIYHDSDFIISCLFFVCSGNVSAKVLSSCVVVIIWKKKFCIISSLFSLTALTVHLSSPFYDLLSKPFPVNISNHDENMSFWQRHMTVITFPCRVIVVS